MKKILLLLMFSLPAILFSQVENEFEDAFKRMSDVFEDEMAYTEEGVFILRFADAQDDTPVSNATIIINNIGTYTTDSEGLAKFPIQEDGKYHFTFKKDGYITSDFTFEVAAQMIYFNRYSVSKVMPLGHVRIVLDWDKTPRDLDLHLEKVGKYHISYQHMRVSDDRTARLDRDDLDGNGPETITITDVDDNATYNCYVHDFTNRNDNTSKKLSKSKARITVYNDNRLEFYLEVPEETLGTRWDGFRIENGTFHKLNRIAN